MFGDDGGAFCLVVVLKLLSGFLALAVNTETF